MAVPRPDLRRTGHGRVLLRPGAGRPAPRGPDPGSPLHHAYVQATTATFAGIVACQIGTAFAARTEHTSLKSVGVTTNRLLLRGIAFELTCTAALLYLPPLQEVLGTAPLPLDVLVLIAPFPIVVWGADELRRAHRRRSDA